MERPPGWRVETTAEFDEDCATLARCASATITRARIELDQLDRTRANALAARNQAIQTALAAGLTIRTVAAHAGISNPAVHKIRYLQLATSSSSRTETGRDDDGATAA